MVALFSLRFVLLDLIIFFLLFMFFNIMFYLKVAVLRQAAAV